MKIKVKMQGRLQSQAELSCPKYRLSVLHPPVLRSLDWPSPESQEQDSLLDVLRIEKRPLGVCCLVASLTEAMLVIPLQSHLTSYALEECQSNASSVFFCVCR